MASIPLTYDIMRRNYPEKLQELSLLVQNSKGQDRNMAPEDMTWSIEYATQVQAFNINDLLSGRNREIPPPRHFFEFKVVAGRIIKTVSINFTPREFTDSLANEQRRKEEAQNRLNTSLQRANADTNGTWLRVSAKDERGRPCVHAFPILAAFKTSKNKNMIVTDSYDSSFPHGCYYLENQTAVILEKIGTERMISLFQETPDGNEVRVQNRKLTKMSQSEIKSLTDFTVYTEDLSDMLDGMGGLMSFVLPGRPRRG